MSSSQKNESKVSESSEIPVGNPSGFFRYFRDDFISGLLVFLIALPLCLIIAISCGFPAIAGVFTAIAGAFLTMWISNSELTIKGPAAGLILIVLTAVEGFGYTQGADPMADMQAYRMALAVGVVAGVIQIVFGMVRAGVLGDFFPTSVVHGMLAAIGVIIVLKQLPHAIGADPKGGAIEILETLPERLMQANPDITAIGITSLLILFGFGYWKQRTQSRWVKAMPAQLLVLLVAVPMGMWFDLSHDHTYTFLGHEYKLTEKFLVDVPNNLLSAIQYPDFSAFTNERFRFNAITAVIMFALIGSLESMLSAKAIDMIDPWRRKTNLNRDLVAIGIANTLVSCVGGLPMISEIVRSKANIDNGAKTRFANFWHGIFLLGFVALLPGLIHRVPLSALAAMLVYTGFRLASPTEFFNVYKTGREQLIIFVSTMIGVLMIDLLVGIGIGIVVKLIIHVLNGLPLRSMLLPYLEVTEQSDNTVVISAKGSAVFSNFIPFRRQIEQLGLVGRNNVVVDLSATTLVDHSVMEKLHEMEMEFEQNGLSLQVQGLDGHRALSSHPFSARKRGLTTMRRMTAVLPASLETPLVEKAFELGASGYTVLPCRGRGRHDLEDNGLESGPLIRMEIITRSPVAEQLMQWISETLSPHHPITVCVETVEVNFHSQY